MYFATGSARLLSLANVSGSEDEDKTVIGINANSRKNLFFVLTKSNISIWKVRPPVLLASVQRTKISVDEHGANVAAFWSPEGSKIAIHTTASFVVLVNIYQTPDYRPLSRLSVASIIRTTFLPGPGEGLPLEGLYLQLRGVIKIDGELLCLSPRITHLLFATRNPAAVQQLPWPQDDEEEEDAGWLGHETWSLNEQQFPWLDGSAEGHVTLSKIRHTKTSAAEGWITNDGKAYFTHLTKQERDPNQLPEQEVQSPASHKTTGEDESVWLGTRLYPDSSSLGLDLGNNPSKGAVDIALNSRFSIVAVGLEDGELVYIPFPSQEGTLAPPKFLKIPDLSLYGSCGRVTSLEWTSDGYALAVGWQNGWGIVSVGGRFLAWNIGASISHPEYLIQDPIVLELTQWPGYRTPLCTEYQIW
ncbi:7276_t:CDS:2 [Acaulospora colombiana]|uniref:7276_t:CDS:1 n=1 Tax=Acaulospora colombiana TaxID=27376 RepID=A0ACA9LDP6_9GLOM|nr:7276_t:CDS:2 [Acaulospora colombiana]